MITVTKYRHQWVAVLGLGRTGLAATFSLLTGGAKVVVWESNEQVINNIEESNDVVSLLCKNAIANDKLIINPDVSILRNNKIKTIVISPGINLDTFKDQGLINKIRQLGLEITSDIELLDENCNKAILVGITGTNGKSTTTALTSHIFTHAQVPTQMGGNIGVACLTLEPLCKRGVYVLEVSSYQLDLLKKAHFNIAIMLNITPDHYDRHKDFIQYKAAKLKIFNNQTKDDYAIISVDGCDMQDIFDHVAQGGRQRIIPISVDTKLNNGVSIIDDILYDYINSEHKIEIKLPILKYLPGLHNKQNIAASYACARLKGINENKIISALQTFRGLRHRLQLVLEYDGLKFINDSKATNATSTEQALKAFDNVYWILGGIQKDGGINSLKGYFKKIKHAYLIGSSQDDFAYTLKDENVEFTKANDLENALNSIKQLRIKSGVILFSPACASFDQWKDFEHRGEAFEQLVRDLWKN